MVAVPLTLNMVTEKTKKKSTDASLLPAFLQGATTWRFENPPGTNMANCVLRFKVIQAGRVYLIAHWQYQGNPSGGWLEERLTKEQLVEQGWQDLGPCSWDKEVYVLTRRVNEGESYAIRIPFVASLSPHHQRLNFIDLWRSLTVVGFPIILAAFFGNSNDSGMVQECENHTIQAIRC